MENYFKSGTYNALCHVCGFKYKADEMKLRWDGVYVCPKDWEPRHPQDFVNPDMTEQHPTWTQPESEDKFLDLTAPRNIG